MRIGGEELSRRGALFIVSGPSGAGKTSICTPVLQALQGIELSVSYTTREPRGGERDGVDYRFVGASKFTEMTARGEFAEWAEVHGHRYGTAKTSVDEALAAGRDLLLDIDVQGAQQIKAIYQESVAIFLLPPSKQRLAERLIKRGTDDAASVRKRLDNACREITRLGSYDYVIVNEDLETAVRGLSAIVCAERLRIERMAPSELDKIRQAFDAAT